MGNRVGKAWIRPLKTISYDHLWLTNTGSVVLSHTPKARSSGSRSFFLRANSTVPFPGSVPIVYLRIPGVGIMSVGALMAEIY